MVALIPPAVGTGPGRIKATGCLQRSTAEWIGQALEQFLHPSFRDSFAAHITTLIAESEKTVGESKRDHPGVEPEFPLKVKSAISSFKGKTTSV